jgi:HlyD family secretion protein
MKKKLLLLVLLILTAGGTATWFYARGGPEPADSRIRVSGNLEVTDAEVSFKVAGRVSARLVSEGEMVRAGVTVATLDDTEFAQEVGLREADVRAAEADLRDLEAGSRPEEIAQGEAALALATAEAERWRLEAARQQDLFSKDVVSAHDHEVAATANSVAQARVNEARQQLALLRQGPRIEKILQARARLAKARQALAVAETRLGYAVLQSPLSGFALAEHVEPGEIVNPGSPIVTIGDLERVWLRAYINETDLGRVALGQRVRLTTDGDPNTAYWGQISFISPEAEFTPKNVQTQQERVKLVYRIKVLVPNPKLTLKPGMPADAEIIAEQPAAGKTGPGKGGA